MLSRLSTAYLVRGRFKLISGMYLTNRGRPGLANNWPIRSGIPALVLGSGYDRWTHNRHEAVALTPTEASTLMAMLPGCEAVQVYQLAHQLSRLLAIFPPAKVAA